MSNNGRPTKENKSSGNTTFMYVYDGEFRQSIKAEQADEKSVKRSNKEGREIYENRFSSLTGRILAIGVNERDLPNGKKEKEVEIKLKDDYGIVFLKMSLQGKFANEFVKKLPRVDLLQDVTMYPSYFKQENKSFFTIKQNDEKIKNYFTKDEPNGLPQPTIFEKSDGTKVWDFGAQTLFFEEMIDRIFKVNCLNIASEKDLLIDAEKEIKVIAKEFANKAKKTA